MPVAAAIKPYLDQTWTSESLDKLLHMLTEAGTFNFAALPNGLFPAALALQEDTEYTGYSNCWVRDNVLVAYGLYASGEIEKPVHCMQTLCDYFLQYRHRFDDNIAGKVDPDVQNNRPHIRIDGKTAQEIDQAWAHAQNDALGYFLWFYCKLAREKKLDPSPAQAELLMLFVDYFNAIEFWQDEDSGHWEEVRKIAASSVGTATAGLLELSKLYDERPDLFSQLDESCAQIDQLESAITKGQQALNEILPHECIQPNPLQTRKYDAALLFLIEPLGIVSGEMADTIIANVNEHLVAEHGIRRYLGDSYWCADYKDKLAPEKRTQDFSGDQTARDALLTPGEEAQWCIFDPILSIIAGKKYLESNEDKYRELQIKHFERALTQLTSEQSRYGALRCPESYYMEKGSYVPNDITPLFWTQANLLQSVKMMQETTKS